MGTEINLRICGISLSYSKNHMGIDFGHLFQDGDLTRRRMEEINYDYYASNPEEIADLEVSEMVFARTLGRMVPRLELLNHSLASARMEYEAVLAEEAQMALSGDPSELTSFLTFEEFCALACRYPLNELKDDYVEYQTLDRGKVAQGRFAADAEEFARIPGNRFNDQYYSEKSYLSSNLCILSAESMLRVFALNPANLDAEVVWEFGPLARNGWASIDDFRPGARRVQKVLVATEGASDSRVIKRALEILRPDVADFFNYVDLDERHHFWGASNLVKFAEGLLRIDIQNKVLFVFDNDAEGMDAFRKLGKLSLPANIRSMLLPNLEVFRSFAARGPEGVSKADINGRAAAIECYLDLDLPNVGAAQVLWSNYKKDIDAWHGALEFKESYQHHFFSQSDEALRDGPYDSAKLSILLDTLIEEAGNVSFTV
ncbi:HEPN/Toprim-associated domain-containing protein [Neotabrizicola sp. sgz301269]|uniref:HEPN/Toprim-associated domain-containing protein n=1 Tax=Neotabrizicola sp. sgz301269 TaxID=3276282 RepID=UPI00376FB0BE